MNVSEGRRRRPLLVQPHQDDETRRADETPDEVVLSAQPTPVSTNTESLIGSSVGATASHNTGHSTSVHKSALTHLTEAPPTHTYLTQPESTAGFTVGWFCFHQPPSIYSSQKILRFRLMNNLLQKL